MAPAPPPAVEEGKLLSDALSTVKIQVVQMKRHLVRMRASTYSSKANQHVGR
jgi:hypothetical protein